MREMRQYLLCMLSDHEDKREVVHPQSRIEQSIGVHKENNVFDCIFDQVGL